MSKPASRIDRLPHPSSWVPLKSSLDGLPANSNWTSIYQACLHPQLHSDLIDQIHSHSSSLPPSVSSGHVVVKRVSPHLTRPPHDTRAEISCLARLDHPNIVRLLAYLEPPDYPDYCLFLPLYPATIYNLLHKATEPFLPSNYPGFDLLVRRIVRDIGSGLRFLHGHSMAHRDINPSNVALTYQGHAVLIDFGTVWPGHPSPESNALEFELGTMPYRAPELLFGSRAYSPYAIDVWAFGALIAEFYRPLEEEPDEKNLEDDRHRESSHNWSSNARSALDWYSSNTPTDLSSLDSPALLPQPPRLARRKTLFDGTVGDIGLVGSIFKTLGTPDSSSWPEANSLPDFSKLEFHRFERQDLWMCLPHLRRDEVDAAGKEGGGLGEAAEGMMEMIEGFLRFDSGARVAAFRRAFPLPDSPSHPGPRWLFHIPHNEDALCFQSIARAFSSL